MTDDAALFHQLDEVFAAILAGASSSGRLRAARSIATTLRRSQSQRIARQETPEGGKFEKRRRRVLRSQAGIRFVWNGEVRRLKNWQTSRGSRGRKLTGFDEDRGAVRTFYRADIERYLDVSFTAVRRDTTKPAPMFQRLRTSRFLKGRADAEGATVGFSGVAARIARVHQFGLRDKVNNSGAVATYPRRELLGLSKADRMEIARQVIDSLGVSQ
nr:MAG TPA: virion morphogenesis protein [Caudoviricetes sp.]